MAFRTAANNHWKSTINNGLKGRSRFTTSTSPKLKEYADASPTSAEGFKTKWNRQGAFIPVYVAAGFITLSASLGLFTVYHQIAHSPNVTARKSRREMIPEVVEPESVAEYGDRFLKQSFFRKIAHIQDFDQQEAMCDPIRGDAFTRPVRLESLKDSEVESLIK